MPKKSKNSNGSPICLHPVVIDVEEEAAALRALRSRSTVLGAETEALEIEFAETCGVGHAIAVSSGAAALQLALMTLDLGPRDEIIQSAIAFPSVANMTVTVGAEPAFADIAALDMPRISVADIERAWTSRAAAVIVTHYGGVPAEMRAIRQYCQDHSLCLIEDASHVLGTSFQGRMAGTWGDFGCFSFAPGDNIDVGAGGMLVTNSDERAEYVQQLRWHGVVQTQAPRDDRRASGYDVRRHGFELAMSEIGAARARVQLERLAQEVSKRREHARMYAARLAEIAGVDVVDRLRIERSACPFLSIAVDPTRRDAVRRACAQRNIETGWHYPCVAELSAYRDITTSRDIVRSVDFARRQVTLPLHSHMHSNDIRRICEAVQAGLEVAVV